MTNLALHVAHVLTAEAERVERGWSAQGIFAAVTAALEEDDRTSTQVVLAGLSAIADRNAKTPGAIRWPARYVGLAHGPATPDRPKCQVCGRSVDVHDVSESKVSEDQRHPFQEEHRNVA